MSEQLDRIEAKIDALMGGLFKDGQLPIPEGKKAEPFVLKPGFDEVHGPRPSLVNNLEYNTWTRLHDDFEGFVPEPEGVWRSVATLLNDPVLKGQVNEVRWLKSAGRVFAWFPGVLGHTETVESFKGTEVYGAVARLRAKVRK